MCNERDLCGFCDGGVGEGGFCFCFFVCSMGRGGVRGFVGGEGFGSGDVTRGFRLVVLWGWFFCCLWLNWLCGGFVCWVWGVLWVGIFILFCCIVYFVYFVFRVGGDCLFLVGVVRSCWCLDVVGWVWDLWWLWVFRGSCWGDCAFIILRLLGMGPCVACCCVWGFVTLGFGGLLDVVLFLLLVWVCTALLFSCREFGL